MLNNIKTINTHSRTALKLLLIFTAFTVIILSGCDLSYLGMRDTTKGALSISINSSRFAASRSVTPETDMTPSTYVISGSGPGGETFERTSTGAAANVYDLATGNWTITVTAYNNSNEQIGWGESLVPVTASIVSDASVPCRTLYRKGFGCLFRDMG